MNIDFDISGRFVREIKAVLHSVGINEGDAYDAVPFSPASRASGHHTFAFHNKQAALDATAAWQAHVKQRTLAHR
ncbi:MULTISPECIES: hypothetical protein [unclassified Rhizobium]|uniref:hypothetical protein n=1 Tax=unclassified Rhizobium TaxID=2613769 RepID=UPI000712AFCD|nr:MULTISPECIES: hypothetical protein [unclassified Rhizobium]KQS95428.1 hypothetical protein ASG42_29835 [Rhizobium sp. Leaf391]KQT04685.1 hypothetical protein ASG50_15555 [Rhizobium sp. Leaf386]KQU00961.1 hypothetical protein ASG68_29185 [Rhizobium sp. Leaf453]